MVAVPTFILKRLYVKGSLRPTDDGFEFRVENRLGSGYANQMLPVTLDGQEMPLESSFFRREGEEEMAFTAVCEEAPFTLEMNKSLTIFVRGTPLSPGPHKVGLGFVVRGIGSLRFEVSDVVRRDSV